MKTKDLKRKQKAQPGGSLEAMVGRFACEANARNGERCGARAMAAVFRDGTIIPVCAEHCQHALRAGWTVGALPPNTKLSSERAAEPQQQKEVDARRLLK